MHTTGSSDTTGTGSSADTTTGTTGPAGATVVRSLVAAVDAVTVEELRAQDATFDRDSRRGRELLFLAAHGGWLLESTEVVDVGRAHAVDTAVRLTVDPGRVGHEAFRDAGQVLLPLLTLPLLPEVPGRAGGAPAEAALALTVTDAGGVPVAALAPTEVRRLACAALADVLVSPGVAGDARPPVRRAGRLVLSAALQRLLRDRWRDGGSVIGDVTGDGTPGTAPGEPPTDRHGPGRLRVAQRDVRALLADVAGAAAAVVDAVAASLWVVVPVGLGGGPVTYTVRLPARRLVPGGPGSPRRPRARLELGLLFPGADADRRVSIRLPDGVTWEPRPGTGEPAADVRVDVDRPAAAAELAELVRRLGGGDAPGPGERVLPAPVARCLADLAVLRVDAVRQALSHHRPADADLPAALHGLRAALLRDPPAGVGAAWARVALPATLRRDTTVSTVTPGAVEARTERVDDPVHRGSARAAAAVVDVAVTDSELLGSARFAGGLNLVLLTAVLAFLVHSGAHADVEVVAPALTLFAAVQAARVPHPDRTTLHGLLSATGYRLVIPSMLPTVILAVALAFVYPGDGVPSRTVAVTWAAVAIAGQLAFQVALHRGPLTTAPPAPGPARRRSRPPAFVLTTRALVDHDRLAVLRGPWWRAATAEALLAGRDAHAYLVWDRDRTAHLAAEHDAWLGPGARGAALLALLRAGTPRQALSLVVLREPSAAWAAAHGARRVDVAGHRPGPRPATVQLLDVYAAIPRAAPPPVARHPLTRVLRAAAEARLDAVDVQLPVPPPAAVPAGRRWLRVRVAVPAGGLGRCRGFLTGLHDAAATDGWDLMLRAVPEVGEPGAGPAAPVPAAELDVLAGDDGHEDAPLWCVLAVCGRARSGLAADLLDALGARHPGLRLGGLTGATLHGTSVSLLLLRRDAHDAPPDDPPDEPPDVVATVAALAAAHPADHLVAPLAEWQSAAQLGTPPGPGDGPLVRVHLRSPDRPGLVAAALDAVRASLAAATGTDPRDVLAWHARGLVTDARTATLRLVLRLPDPAPVTGWPPERWEELERDVRRRLQAAGAGGDPVVCVQLLRSPGVTAPARHMTS